MPLTDSMGQNVPYPTLTDKNNAQVFGQGIVEGVAPKLVMNFASASVRGATITTPRAGMVTWLGDVKRLEVYDGTAWAVVSAGTSTWTTVPIVTGWTHNGNEQGTFQYRVVNLYGEQTIMFRGGITKDSYPGSLPGYYQLNSSALPTNARPVLPAGTAIRTLVVPCSDISSARITLKLDITYDGWLRLYGIDSTSKPPWIGFNGAFCSL